MRDLVFDANQYKMAGNTARLREYEKYTELAEALREIESELAQLSFDLGI